MTRGLAGLLRSGWRPNRGHWSVASGWGGRIAAAVAQFASVRVLTATLGVDGYGAFAVVAGLLAWFALADLGFGYGLQNHISERRVAGESSITAVLGVVRLLTVTTVVICVVAIAVSPWVGPFLLGKIEAVGRQEAVLAFAIFGVLAAITGAGSVALKICFGNHRGYVAYAITTVAAIAGLAGLAIDAALASHHTLSRAVLLFFAPGAVLPLMFLVGLVSRYRGAEPVERRDERAILGRLWRVSRWFLLFATLGAMVLNLDYVILARTVAPGEIATYSVFSRVYALVLVLFASVLSTYWPVIAESFGRGETDAVFTILRRSVLIGAAIVLAVTLAFWLLLGLIGRLLSPHDPLVLPAHLLPVFFTYAMVRVWTDACTIVVVGEGSVAAQCGIVAVQAVCSVVLGVLGAHFYGVPGFMTGLTVSYLVTAAWMLPLFITRVIMPRSRRRDAVAMAGGAA